MSHAPTDSMSQERLDLIFKHTAFLTVSISLCFPPALRENLRCSLSQRLLSAFNLLLYNYGPAAKRRRRKKKREALNGHGGALGNLVPESRSAEQARLLSSISARIPGTGGEGCGERMHWGPGELGCWSVAGKEPSRARGGRRGRALPWKRERSRLGALEEWRSCKAGEGRGGGCWKNDAARSVD